MSERKTMSLEEYKVFILKTKEEQRKAMLEKSQSFLMSLSKPEKE